MRLDNIEGSLKEIQKPSIEEKMTSFHESFESRINGEDKSGIKPDEKDSVLLSNINGWIGENIDSTHPDAQLDSEKIPYAMDILSRMVFGADEHGIHTLGLKEVSDWKINDEYRQSNIRQQSGYAAEIISTSKDNLQSLAGDTGLKTFRADDRPDLFDRNDQYVDKVTFDAKGNLVERTQVKFVGHDGESCLQKLMSDKFAKYYDDGNVDKIEIPSDFYDEIREGKLIDIKLQALNTQLQKVQELGKTDVAENLKKRIDRLEKIDRMLKRSSVSLQDAIDARLDPQGYLPHILNVDQLKDASQHALKEGINEAKDTAVKSSVEHVSKVLRKEESFKEAGQNIAIETGTAAFKAAKTAFVDDMTAEKIEDSSRELIRQMPSEEIGTQAAESGMHAYQCAINYAQGRTDFQEFAFEMGDKIARNAGKAAGTAAGGIIGARVPGVGMKRGAIIGGAVGTAVAGAAYRSAVEHGSENVEMIGRIVKENANKTLELTKQLVPEKVETVRSALNQFAIANDLPYTV